MACPLKEPYRPRLLHLANPIRDLSGIETPLRFLDAVIEALPNMVFVKEARTLRFVRFNRAGEELLGYSRGELLGKNDYDFFPREQADFFTSRDRLVLASRSVVDIPEEPVLTRERGTRILHTKKIPLFARDGTPAFLVGLSEDITDRKKEQEQRSEFLARVSPLLTSSLDYRVTLRSIAKLAVPTLADWCTVTIVSEQGDFERLAAVHRDPAKTPLLEGLLGSYPKHAAVKTRLADVIRDGRLQVLNDLTDEQLTYSAGDPKRLGLLHALGARSAMLVPIPGRERVHGVITLVNSAAGRHFDEEDQSLAVELGRRAGIAIENALLYEATRAAVRARDEFLSIASHELKTPITTLKLHTELNRRKVLESDRAYLDRESILGLLETTSRQVDRLQRLADDLLDITRIASGKLDIRREKVDLGLLAREVLERFSAQLRTAGCEYSVRRENGVIGLWDRYRIEQVLINLITNAIKYGANSPIEVAVGRRQRLARLSVRDHGMGIAPDDMNRIFHRFERAAAAKQVGGLGLGLYICRQIVEAHGGSISVESNVGKGSLFIVDLPVA